MTDTNTLAPTDAEILDTAEDFRSQYMHGGTTFDEFDEIGFTRTALAKWGASAPASSEPAAVPAGMEPEAAPAQPVAHVSQETFNDDGTSDIIIPALPIGMALYAAPQPAVQAAPVDATVQEDAERWQFLAEYLVGPRTDLDDEIVGCDSVQKMARVLDATIAAQKETND